MSQHWDDLRAWSTAICATCLDILLRLTSCLPCNSSAASVLSVILDTLSKMKQHEAGVGEDSCVLPHR